MLEKVNGIKSEILSQKKPQQIDKSLPMILKNLDSHYNQLAL